MLHEDGAGGEGHAVRPSAGVLRPYLPICPTQREAFGLWNERETSVVASRSQSWRGPQSQPRGARHPAAFASSSEQNIRSPDFSLMRVRS